MTTTKDRISHKVDPAKVKIGDLMAFVNYVKVKSINDSGLDLMTNDLKKKNSEIRVKGRDLVESSLSADQYSEEKKVTKTEAAEILINSPNRPLTVAFEKQDHSQRILRGRFISHEALLGRSRVEDLDLDLDDKSERVRLVDHRSIKYVIVDCCKYSVKGK